MKIFTRSMVLMATLAASYSHAHYPFVAPLSYQTFNHHTAIIAGFYDNPFASEVAIKNIKFHYHDPAGQKIYLADEALRHTQTLSSFSLENKTDGTYRIRGEKQGATQRFALDGTTWKPVLNAKFDPTKANDKVLYAEKLTQNTPIKTVQSVELIETFVSRSKISYQVIHHLHDDFDVQFVSHPNAIRAGQAIQFNLLDNKQAIAHVEAKILTQTHDFSREEKVFKTVKANGKGELHFKLEQAGQYLLTIDYQQPFSHSGEQLKRYKYTLAFNVTP